MFGMDNDDDIPTNGYPHPSRKFAYDTEEARIDAYIECVIFCIIAKCSRTVFLTEELAQIVGYYHAKNKHPEDVADEIIARMGWTSQAQQMGERHEEDHN